MVTNVSRLGSVSHTPPQLRKAGAVLIHEQFFAETGLCARSEALGHNWLGGWGDRGANLKTRQVQRKPQTRLPIRNITITVKVNIAAILLAIALLIRLIS